MIAVKELQRWLSTLVSDEVGIDEGGLTLVAGDPEADSGAYLEIGGIPLDDEESDTDDDFESSQDHWSSPNGCHADCPACVEEEANRPRVAVASGIPKFVLSRDGKLKGEVTGTRRCRLEGRTGIALKVKWPDGQRTYPCGKATEATDDPDNVKIG